MNVLTSLLPALLIVPSLVYGQAKEGWREVFRDDFERQELGPRWNKGSGAEIKDGWLTTGGRETFAWIRQELAFPAIRIEYDAYVRRVTPKSAFSDLSCALSPSREPGFQKEACWFLFASGNNEKSELRGPQGFSLKTDSAKAKAKEGRVYHVRAELNGRVMRLSINGRMLIEGLQSIDPQRRFACVYSWSGIARFDNVRVMVKDQADPVPAGILAPEPAGIYEMQQTLAHIRDWSLPEIANPKPPSTDIIRVPIKIENVVDGAGTFPVTFGVPVPRDTIWDSDSIRIVDSEGNEMPSQFEITGTWNDPRRGGSVRWLLADFTPAVAESGYSVEYGRRVRRSAIDSPLIVRKTDTSIAVESRQLKVMVSKTRGTVLEALWYDPDGKRQFTELTRILNSERHRGAYFIDQKGKLCAT
ncbi:MAG: hypothetical protein QF886_04215, partial [Planctomycetota bacterium]|nr:hypothetical protein [Planctomycetota bacterium]